MELKCENCKAKIGEKAFLAITSDKKAHFLCQNCGVWHRIFSFSDELETIFEVEKVENRGIQLRERHRDASENYV